MNTKKTTRARRRRSALGAVMMETVFILPFIMVMIVLIMYFGWNYRRMAQVTNMDRYSAWQRATPGSPGPDKNNNDQDDANARLNHTFYDANNDLAQKLVELDRDLGYSPAGHETLRDQQVDETYSYFDKFLEINPRGIIERFEATHGQIVSTPEDFGLDDLTRNAKGHQRLNGDWRYLNGIRYNQEKQRWEPAHRRVSPGESLREVFFAELDDGLESYDNQGNKLARAIREFYLDYPAYGGPDVSDLEDSSGGAF